MDFFFFFLSIYLPNKLLREGWAFHVTLYEEFQDFYEPGYICSYFILFAVVWQDVWQSFRKRALLGCLGFPQQDMTSIAPGSSGPKECAHPAVHSVWPILPAYPEF